MNLVIERELWTGKLWQEMFQEITNTSLETANVITDNGKLLNWDWKAPKPPFISNVYVTSK